MIAVSAVKRTLRLELVSAAATGEGLPSGVARTPRSWRWAIALIAEIAACG